MDNNKDYEPQRPRKKVSRETLRMRQFCALAVIALIILLLLLFAAAKCSKGSKGGKEKPAAVTTTTSDTTTTTSETTTTTATTTTTPDPINNSDFKLDKYSLELAVGGKDMPRVTDYPQGSGEWNEMWSSSDENIASVDKYGNITGVSEGECYIILRDGGDPTQEVQIRVKVSGTTTTTSGVATTTTTAVSGATEPQSANMAEAPAPSKINVPDAHYEGDTLIVNKTYGLPESYDPQGLNPTCEEWLYKLIKGAAQDNLTIYLSSGYRSYETQQQIYNSYVGEFGTATADTFSARPGFSEHQTGLAIDVNQIDDSFAGTPEAIWLAEHCYDYGFIIRYPEGKQAITGYKYEPWHIRYVGTEVAKKMKAMGPNYTLEELYGLTSQYQD